MWFGISSSGLSVVDWSPAAGINVTLPGGFVWLVLGAFGGGMVLGVVVYLFEKVAFQSGK